MYIPEELQVKFEAPTEQGRKTLTALRYGGRQFGFYRDLGDGRSAILAHNDNGALILKGGLVTPLNLYGDGVLSFDSAQKEQKIAQRLQALNICSQIVRQEMKAHNNKGTQLLVWRPNPFRIGTIEYLHRHHPELVIPVWRTLRAFYGDLNDYKLLEHVQVGYLRLAQQWRAVRFVHGCLNTDNMSLIPCGIDYGRSYFVGEGELDTDFDPLGRYSYENQQQAVEYGLQILTDILNQYL